MTEYLKLDESCSTGVDKFDNQHKKLLELLNKLLGTIKEHDETSGMGALLKDLLSFAFSHFNDEEDVLRRFGYEDLEEHIKEHDKIKLMVGRLHHNYLAGNLPEAIEILEVITRWFEDHLKKTDMQYGPFLKEKGFK
ncbi:MAG: bacteriohemerythrin [Nitrospinota bacterium]